MNILVSIWDLQEMQKLTDLTVIYTEATFPHDGAWHVLEVESDIPIPKAYYLENFVHPIGEATTETTYKEYFVCRWDAELPEYPYQQWMEATCDSDVLLRITHADVVHTFERDIYAVTIDFRMRESQYLKDLRAEYVAAHPKLPPWWKRIFNKGKGEHD